MAAWIVGELESNIFDSLTTDYPLTKVGSLLGFGYNTTHFELLNNQLSIKPTYINNTINQHIDNSNIHFEMNQIQISQSQITDLDLSGEYYNKTESDNRFLNVTGDTITGDLTIGGNLTVNGSQFITNTETVEIEDNLLVINKNEVGSGVTNGLAGIEVERGTATNYQFLFDESSDNFKVGQIESLQAVATREDSPLNGGFAY
ncbi:hypothetical protein [Gaoshiqia sediminis]|uniref:Uncharacterized protein n=1 Tax=Gaoshiqia sediminis TaxID=2986998 RepID=A0AA42CB26_9BACT|nr:hypothetical protein [Gaoshiqia sediminis]MCW0484652.1 hypothetical protein [Gaoshiqia sediminis]